MRKTFDECNPCAFHYDAIIKMETFSEDVSSILEAVGAGWIAPAHANNRKGSIQRLTVSYIRETGNTRGSPMLMYWPRMQRLTQDLRHEGYLQELEQWGPPGDCGEILHGLQDLRLRGDNGDPEDHRGEQMTRWEDMTILQESQINTPKSDPVLCKNWVCVKN